MDPMQELFDTVNHECGHAVSSWLLGEPIAEIDVDRPDARVAGWVKPGRVDLGSIPHDRLDSTDDAIACVDARLAALRRRKAISARMGALVTRLEWDSPVCARDRSIVESCRPDWLSLESWDTFVTVMAEELMQDPRFKPAMRALARYCLDHQHEKITGDVAVQVMEAAVVEAALVEHSAYVRPPFGPTSAGTIDSVLYWPVGFS